MKRLAIIVLIEAILVIAIIVLFATIYGDVFADEYFIICKPGVYINVRFHPNKRAEVIGELELGDKVESDGKEQNGFIHVTGLSFEFTEGWIYKGLLVKDEPYICEWGCQIISDSRVAARHYINGKRKGWIKPGKEVTVYAVSRDWSITEKGYVQTRFLSVNYPEIQKCQDGD